MPLRKGLVVLSLALIGVAASGGAFSQEPSAPLRPGGHHGHGHAQNHDWYQQLKQPGTGYSCCNGTIIGPQGTIEGDCRPTRAYQGDDGTWHALIDGRWVSVPPRVVLKELAPDGRNHICASRSGVIFCFLGGSPRS